MPKKIKGILTVFVLGAIAALVAFSVFVPSVGRIHDRVNIEVLVPQQVEAASRVRFEVRIANRNDIDLQEVALIFYYPSGSQQLFGGEQKNQERRVLGTISAGASLTEVFESRLFFADEARPGRVVLEYRVARSNAILTKEKAIENIIIKSPLSIEVTAPDDVREGQEVAFDVRLISQADAPLINIAVRVQYPVGFIYKTSTIAPVDQGTTWVFPTLSTGEELQFTISGVMSGFEGERKSLIFSTGVLEQNTIFNRYAQFVKTISLLSSFIDIDIKVRPQHVNDRGEFFVSAGETLNVAISYKNNLPVSLESVTVRAKLEGDMFDIRQLRVERGFFDSRTSSIVWNTGSNADLAKLIPGQEGELKFTIGVDSNPVVRTTSDKNFLVKITTTLDPAIVPESLRGVDITARDEFNALLTTQLQLAPKMLYFYDPLPGHGPIPPRVNQETVYTVIWSLANSVNDIRDVVVEGTLPAYMIWKNSIVPAGQDIRFDSSTGRVQWRVGTVLSGTGSLRPALSAAFQVGFVPSLSQVGSQPILLTGLKISGVDNFTEVLISDSRFSELTTQLRDDPAVSFGQGTVVE